MRRLLEWMERPLRAPAASGRAADVIVVLGAPCRNGVPGRFALERARAAAALWARGAAPAVLVTGGPVHDPEPEADIMGKALRALGVPEAALVLEGVSLHTRENAQLSTAIARERGWRRALLVTQRFHSRRSLREFQRTGWWDAVEVVCAESEVTPAEMARRPGRAAYFMVREYLAWVRRWR